MIECACNNKECKTYLSIDEPFCRTVMLHVNQTDERWACIELDANAVVLLIWELHKALRGIAEEPGKTI